MRNKDVINIEIQKMKEMQVPQLAQWLYKMVELEKKLHKSNNHFNGAKYRLKDRITIGVEMLAEKSNWKGYNWRKMINVTRHWGQR